jgi:DNA-binding transcriptional regulator YhcF (GntR family)
MDFVLNRGGGVPIRDQIVTQLEVKILEGTLAPGEKLPSVRALARRLAVHANTISAAYQDLEGAGVVRLQRGAGVFVRERRGNNLESATGLDEIIRLAIHAAFRQGHSGRAIRRAVERWIAAAPPDHVIAVDGKADVAELLAHELSEALGMTVTAHTMSEVSADATLLAGSLTVASPYHAETLRELAPGAALEVIHIEAADASRRAFLELPAGSIVLVVASAPTILPFARTLIKSLRGDDLHVETLELSDARAWRRLVSAADLVVTDTSSRDAVSRVRPRALHVAHLISPSSLNQLRDALTIVVPPVEARTRRRTGKRPA